MKPELTTLTASPWRDARGSLVSALSHLGQLPRRERNELALAIAAARPETPAALWLAEELTVLGSDPGVLTDQARDHSWADRLAVELAGSGRIGALSMGRTTHRILGTLSSVASHPPTVIANSTVVGKGLEDLGLDIEIGDPTAGEAVLIPVAAISVGVVWTSEAGARALAGGRRPILCADPVTMLGGWALERFAPAEWLVEVETGGPAVPS